MQFDKVEGPGPAAPPACAQCRRPLDEYFALGGHMFCRVVHRLDSEATARSLLRALLFGAGAAVRGDGRLVRWSIALTHATRGSSASPSAASSATRSARDRAAAAAGNTRRWRWLLTYVSITGSCLPEVIEAGSDSSTLRSCVPFLGSIPNVSWAGSSSAIALYEAWKLNRRVPITGPFRFGGGLSVPAPAPVTPPGMPPPAAAT